MRWCKKDDDMKNDKAAVDPLPETFDSLEQMAHFWDTHDVTDYA